MSIKVRALEPGQKISEPGVYDLPMEVYHSDCCDGPSISSSGLRTIRSHSPAHYYATSYLNPKAEKQPESAAMRIGRAAHTLLIEPEMFDEQYKVRPAMWTDWRTQQAKDWRKVQVDRGVTVLSGEELLKIVGIAEALRAHPLHELGILEGDIERSLIWKDEVTGVWLKARPDAIPRGSDMFADLKCMHDARAEQLTRDVFDRGYDMQLALAGMGMQELLGRKMDTYTLVVVENSPPHAVRIAPIANEEIHRARILLRWSIDRFARCLKEDRWPAFEDDDNVNLYRPKWAAEAFEREFATSKVD